jgi:hypothetical protein
VSLFIFTIGCCSLSACENALVLCAERPDDLVRIPREPRVSAMSPNLPDDAWQAIQRAQRKAGWQFLRGEVLRFVLETDGKHAPCVLYVVPARRWAYWRWERQAISRAQHRGVARG